jgi:hypothetical protein
MWDHEFQGDRLGGLTVVLNNSYAHLLTSHILTEIDGVNADTTRFFTKWCEFECKSFKIILILVQLIQNTSLRYFKYFLFTNTEQNFKRMRRGEPVKRINFCPYLQSYCRRPTRINSVRCLKYRGSLRHP